jgi:glucose/arabinose dehydrogenase
VSLVSLVILMAWASVAAAGPVCEATPGGTAQLVEVVRGLKKPVYVDAPAGDPRLFLAERGGAVRVVKDGALLPEPLLEVEAATGGWEQGLLGLAFHPKFAENGRVFVYYTAPKSGAGVVDEYRVQGERAVAGSRRERLRFGQPYSNHNGGQLAFGPDGMLYLGVGDGGAGGDPQGHGQNRKTLLGSILRLDVDAEGLVPADNPFVGDPDAADPIWAYGLRNPWRFSFAPDGALWIGDVGQNAWEEIDRIPPGVSGANLGWNRKEGTRCYGRPTCEGDYLDPVAEYAGRPGCDSVTGGYVVRGSCAPSLQGQYVYADFCRNTVWALGEGKPRDITASLDAKGLLDGVSSFGEDGFGELYVVSHGDGVIYRVEDR